MTILDQFRQAEALLEGHFLLTSGLHSANYFQCAKALQYPSLLVEFSRKIVDFFKDEAIEIVISPAVGGIVLGTEVGRQLNVKTIFAERVEGKMTLRRGFEINSDSRVLVVEDVVTTGGSVFEILDIINLNKAKAIGVGFIIDRSNGLVKFPVNKQFSLARVEVKTFSSENCPLCKAGTGAIKPGSRTLKQ